MIEIVTSSELSNEGKIHTKCKIKRMSGKYSLVTAEVACMIDTIESEFPGMIGEALQLMIEDARGRT